jgi:nitroimidazol reductase NimA-like FMN-containing flavoprotein (pyridoxamine 5'-phosphate oxidase superfamily)
VLPTIHARLGDVLYLHGSTGSGWLSALRSGGDVSVTATILDGLVLARSATHHSMNYRSAVVFGQATEVRDPDEKVAALRAVVEHVVAGRWDECRPPSERELASTLVLAVPLVEASAKVRTGPPLDDETDYKLEVWAGEVPLRIAPLAVVPDPRLGEGIPPAASLRSLA